VIDVRKWITEAIYGDEPPSKHDEACDLSCLAGPDEPERVINWPKLWETIRRMKVKN